MLSGIETRGLGVCIPTKRIPGIGSRLPREELPCIEIILSEEGRIQQVCPRQLGKTNDPVPKGYLNGVSYHPSLPSFPKE